MDLSIITVTYQSKQYIDSCILSVVAHTLNCTYEHIIVDNASTDGTTELIASSYANYVKVIKNKENVGFAAANNQALKQAKGRYLLFLNPDMALHEGWLDTLIAWMDKRPDVGIASCKLLATDYLPHAALRPCKFPSLAPYLLAFLNIKPFFCSVHPSFFYPSFDDNKEQEVENVRGAFMLIPNTIVKKLQFAFDPRYFILFEDIDLCREVNKLGFKVMYIPSVSCVDYFGRSFNQKTRAWKYVQMAKSLKTYVRKWHSPLHLVWLALVIPIGFLLRIPKWGIKASIQSLKTRMD
jgi:GT2 family glycosyltransferase